MLVIGIAGGSGSGKSTFSREVCKGLHDADLAVIHHDSFYKPLDHMTVEERGKQNFDHPNSLDTAMMVTTIKALKRGERVEIPHYDFNLHTRKPETTMLSPPTVLLVEGILIFTEPEARELFDMRIFIDTDDDDRLSRRIRRDMNERGRSLDSILNQ
jgi:uridine kinase